MTRASTRRRSLSLLPWLAAAIAACSPPQAAPREVAPRVSLREVRYPTGFVPAAHRESPPAPPIRLEASDGTALTLVAVKTRTVVEDPVALTELHLTFENPEDRVIEGRFTIAPPEGASVSRFAMKIGERWQEGEVVEKRAARRAYEDFLHRGKDPALLERGAGNRFSARVFPIAAREKKELIVTYGQTLPRPGSTLVPLEGLPELPTLRAEVHESGKRHQFVRAAWRPEGDLRSSTPASARDRGVAHGKHVVLRIDPRLPTKADPVTRAVVLFDTSASRAAGFAGSIRRLQALVKALPPTAELEVWAFDQSIERIHAGPARAFGKDATKRLRTRRALGASDLGAALAAAGTRAKATGATRVIVLTDGVATAHAKSRKALTAAAEAIAHQGVARIDVIAPDGVRDRDALDAIAKGGVRLDESVGAAALAARLGRSTPKRAAVKVDGARWSSPSIVGPAVGEGLLVHAELDAEAGERITVRVGERSMVVPLRQAPGPLVTRAVASARIDALLGAPGVDREAPDAKTRAAVVALATKHRVISPLTSMIVLETEADFVRYGIKREALSDILSVKDGRVAVVARSPLPKKAPRRPRRPRRPRTPRPAASGAPARSGWAQADSAGDPMAARGNMWGDSIGDSFGAGGLGLSGIGQGGGGRGEAIGLGSIGTIGHGAQPARGTGQGFGSGHGRLSGRRRARPPRVRHGRVTVSGGLDRAIITRVMAQATSDLRRCYERALTRDPSLAGRLALRLEIGADGRVKRAAVGSSDLRDTTLERCVSQRAARLRFPKSSSDFRISYPMRFSPRRGVRAAGPPKANPHDGPMAEIERLIAANKGDEALAHAVKWRDRAPAEVLPLVGLGQALLKLERPALAARAFGSIVDLHPKRADLRRFAGAELERVADAAARRLALDSYETALALRPDHPSSHRKVAFALLERGRHADAFAALEKALTRRYPNGRFRGVRDVLREDLGIVGAAWVAASPKDRADIERRLRAQSSSLAHRPSLRFVLSWETDVSDVDLHVHDDRGGHAFYQAKRLPSGGKLHADVTTGYGPECFTVLGSTPAKSYRVRAHYYARGPMGFGLGRLQVVRHDGKGAIRLEQRPFVVMKDRAYVELGTYRRGG